MAIDSDSTPTGLEHEHRVSSVERRLRWILPFVDRALGAV